MGKTEGSPYWIRSNFSKVEKLKKSFSKSGPFRTSGSTFCSRRTRGRFDSDLNGRLASPDYEPPFSSAKPGISCGLLVFLSKNVEKLVLFLMFSSRGLDLSLLYKLQMSLAST